MEKQYIVGHPFWRFFARFGYALKIRVEVVRDHAGGVFVATSGDLCGLVCEAETRAALEDEIRRSANVLLLLAYHPKPAPRHFTELRFHE